MNTPWYLNAIFYHIYPLGLLDAPKGNDPNEPVQERLKGLNAWLPHLKSMGVNALYIGPLFQSENHGYDTVDYGVVDRRLGTNDTLVHFVQECHTQGIHVILDAVLNHVGRSFFAFQDVREKGAESSYVDWFQHLRFEGQSPLGDPFQYEGWSGHYDLVKLNLQNPEVKAFLLQQIKQWIETFDIDGLRLDAADVMDKGFLSEMAAFCRELKKDFWLMGEVVHGNYNEWANPDTLHATTNYECYKGLYSSHNDHNYFEIAHSLERLFDPEKGICKDVSLYNFLDNHDVNRIMSRLTDPKHVFNVYGLMWTIPGVPSLYYGSEWMLKGERGPDHDHELRPPLVLDEMLKNHPRDLIEFLTQLSGIRQNSKALKWGAYKTVYLQSEQIAFLRYLEGDTRLVVSNMASEDKEIQITLPDAVLLKSTDDGSEIAFDNAQATVLISAYSLALYEVHYPG